MNDIINNIKHITEQDKSILTQINLTNNYDLCKKLSFYSHKFTIHELNDYNYIKTCENEKFYVTTIKSYGYDTHNVIFDSDKNILFMSRWWFKNNGTMSLIENIKKFYDKIDGIDLFKLDVDNKILHMNNVLNMQKWFESYGHFMDDMFVLADFTNKYFFHSNKRLKLLYDYTKRQSYTLNFDWTIDTLFGENYINPIDTNYNLICTTNMVVLIHNTQEKTFHSFPRNVVSKIFQTINFKQPELANNCKETPNSTISKIFITRSDLNTERNLLNRGDVEMHLKNKHDFALINPEDKTIYELIHAINSVDLIVITWGSALTNLIYAKQNAKVIILKSKSYEREPIHWFNQIFEPLNLSVRVLMHVNNEIVLTELDLLLN